MSLTEKQREYIEYILTNRFTDEKDQESLRRHLQSTGKQAFTQLSKLEASALIEDLLHRNVEYELVCGKRVTMERTEGHRLDLFGESEACGHHCPDELYVGDCEAFMNYDRELHSNLE